MKERERKGNEMQQEIIHTFAVCAYKDSPYLEECLRSVTSQTVKSEVICCTSTPSSYIRELTARYQVPLYVRDGASNIREDWMFAYGKAQGRFVTIAHQDDRYRSDYAEKLLKAWKKYPDLLLFASDYLTIRMTEKEGKMKAIPEPFNMVWLVKRYCACRCVSIFWRTAPGSSGAVSGLAIRSAVRPARTIKNRLGTICSIRSMILRWTGTTFTSWRAKKGVLSVRKTADCLPRPCGGDDESLHRGQPAPGG